MFSMWYDYEINQLQKGLFNIRISGENLGNLFKQDIILLHHPDILYDSTTLLMANCCLGERFCPWASRYTFIDVIIWIFIFCSPFRHWHYRGMINTQDMKQTGSSRVIAHVSLSNRLCWRNIHLYKDVCVNDIFLLKNSMHIYSALCVFILSTHKKQFSLPTSCLGFLGWLFFTVCNMGLDFFFLLLQSEFTTMKNPETI